MYCPSCGKSIAEGSAFCMHCGKRTGVDALAVVTGTPTPSAPQSSASSVAQPSATKCPKCGQIDAVRHVRDVVAQGVTLNQSTTQTSGYSAGVGVTAATGGYRSISLSGQRYSATSYSKGVSMTVLAARLFELANGIEQYNQSLMPPASDRPRPSFLKPFSPPVGAPIQPFVFYELELQFRNSLLEKYFYDKCENLYYCERDAGVFAPGQNEFTTLDNLEQLLYKYPAVTEQHISQIERVSWVTLGKAKAYNTSGVETFWAAMAYGENRVYIINQLRWDEQWLKNGHDKTNGRDLLPSSNVMWSPLSTCSECSSAYNRIISDLEAKGWVRLNEQGEYWYQARFVLPRNL